MRILGFEKKWPKLERAKFTTFRFPRKDRDWQVGEEVQIVYKPRSKDREVLGTAKITGKAQRQVGTVDPQRVITREEAIADGFSGYFDMADWLYLHYGDRIFNEVINRLSLTWAMKLINKGGKK